LKLTDKELFKQFRDKQITFDQLLARTFEKNGIASYVVLDDFRHKLNPVLLDESERPFKMIDFRKSVSVDEILKPLEPW
jgi:hypothetical protein